MHLFFLVLVREYEDYYALFRKLRRGGRNNIIQNGKMYRRQNRYWMDQDISNYRPISILILLSKILEKLMKKRLNDFYTAKNFFSTSQFGFIPRRSTECGVFNAVKEIQTPLESGKL